MLFLFLNFLNYSKNNLLSAIVDLKSIYILFSKTIDYYLTLFSLNLNIIEFINIEYFKNYFTTISWNLLSYSSSQENINFIFTNNYFFSLQKLILGLFYKIYYINTFDTLWFKFLSLILLINIIIFFKIKTIIIF